MTRCRDLSTRCREKKTARGYYAIGRISRSVCNKCLDKLIRGNIQIRLRGIFLIFLKKKKKKKRYLIDDWLLWTSYTCIPTPFQLSADIRISDNYCKVDLSISFSLLKNFLIFFQIFQILVIYRDCNICKLHLFSFLQNLYPLLALRKNYDTSNILFFLP